MPSNTLRTSISSTVCWFPSSTSVGLFKPTYYPHMSSRASATLARILSYYPNYSSDFWKHWAHPTSHLTSLTFSRHLNFYLTASCQKAPGIPSLHIHQFLFSSSIDSSSISGHMANLSMCCLWKAHLPRQEPPSKTPRLHLIVKAHWHFALLAWLDYSTVLPTAENQSVASHKHVYHNGKNSL